MSLSLLSKTDREENMVSTVSNEYKIIYWAGEFLSAICDIDIKIKKKFKEMTPLVSEHVKKHKWKLLGGASFSLAICIFALYRLHESRSLLQIRALRSSDENKSS